MSEWWWNTNWNDKAECRCLVIRVKFLATSLVNLANQKDAWIPGSFLYQLFNHCERFVSRCCRNVHIGCELPRPYALLVGDENSGDVTMCGGEWAKTCQVFWTELMISDASPIVPYAFLLADDSCRILIGMSANSCVQAASIDASTRNLFLLYPLLSAVCCQGGANNCVTLSESWRLASFFFTMQTPGFSMLFRCFIWIIVADNYLEPRFEKNRKKFGVLSANLEPETKTMGF